VQTGYSRLVNPKINTINVIPGNWSSTELTWERATIYGNIKHIGLNYLSGFRYRPQYDKHYWDELHPELARIIAYLATARMSRPLAGRAETTALAQALQRDRSRAQPGEFQFASDAMLDNPFGVKEGEIYAWERLQKFQHRFLRYNNS